MSGRSYKSKPSASRARAVSSTISRVKAKRSANVGGARAMGTMPASSGYRPNYGSGSAPEKKANDIDSSGGAISLNVNSTGVFQLLNGIAVGTGINQRIGKKVKCDSIYIRGRISLDVMQNAAAVSTTTAPAQQVRMILFWDSQSNGTTPAVTDLLKAADPSAQLNLDNRDRFKILKDKVFAFGVGNFFSSVGYSGVGPVIANIKVFKKLNLDTFYGTTGANAADVQTGGLWLFFLGDFTAGTSDSIAELTTRLRYTDN